MESNIGKIDQGVRIVVAALIAGAAYKYGLWWLYIVAAVPLLTAVFRYCPLYSLFGWSTCCASCCGTKADSNTSSCCAPKTEAVAKELEKVSAPVVESASKQKTKPVKKAGKKKAKKK